MLFIGGTRNRQKKSVPWNFGNPVLRLPEYSSETEFVKLMDPINLAKVRTYKIETYVRKDIWKRGQCFFSVMVKDGSTALLDIFLAEYNKKIEDQI